MVSRRIKTVSSLTVADLRDWPVWRYTNTETSDDETSVLPVQHSPQRSLDGCVIGCQVVLANGASAWAIVGNIVSDDARATRHFLTLSVEHCDKWFVLSRYHDHDYEEHGPQALSGFLGLTIEDVFPITYDVREYGRGDPNALAGWILAEPLERLTRAELIAMAIR